MGPLAAYLFECRDTRQLMAVCLDPSGVPLPVGHCSGGWHLVREFPLSVHDPMPVAMNPEPVLRGIQADGYFV